MDSTIRAKAIEMKRLGFSYADIGMHFGFTRQRAQQIVKPVKAVCEYVQNRAGNACQDCKCKLVQGGHIHHANDEITGDYNDIEGLMYLCTSCHCKRHHPDLYPVVGVSNELIDERK